MATATGTVSFANSDSDENPFDFTVDATATSAASEGDTTSAPVLVIDARLGALAPTMPSVSPLTTTVALPATVLACTGWPSAAVSAASSATPVKSMLVER